MVAIGEPARITYTNYRGETDERIITPQRVWYGSTDWHPKPQWLLTAFDHEKQAKRDFALKDFGYSAPMTESRGKGSFQDRVKPWMMGCFGEEISNDKMERCDRFIEEALELVQAIGYSPDRAHALVDYVFNREIGESHQEVGGVMVTLAALCLASSLDMALAGEDELARIWTKVEKIRAKQAAKPTGSALPIPTPPSSEVS